jgi:hypothetical protein
VIGKILSVIAAMTFALAVAPGARAADPLAGGTTKLKPGRAVSVVLVSHGITLTHTSWRVTGGEIESGHAAGAIGHMRSIGFRRAGRSFNATAPVINLGTTSTVTGVVGGARITLMGLDLSHAKTTRAGLDTEVTGIIANLTSTAAHALNKTFHTSIFARDLKLGTFSVHVRPASVALASGSAALAFDPAFATALQGLGVAAASSPASDFHFDVSGGRLNAAGKAGSIQLAEKGGFTLQRATATVAVSDLLIRLTKKPRLTAEVGGDRMTVANLGVDHLKVSSPGRRFALSGITLQLTTSFAKRLNQAFATTVFVRGATLGAVTVTTTAAD